MVPPGYAAEDDDFGEGLDAEDLPSTHLDDEAYDTFLAREFDREGRLQSGPPVTRILLGLIVLLALVALLVFL